MRKREGEVPRRAQVSNGAAADAAAVLLASPRCLPSTFRGLSSPHQPAPAPASAARPSVGAAVVWAQTGARSAAPGACRDLHGAWSEPGIAGGRHRRASGSPSFSHPGEHRTAATGRLPKCRPALPGSLRVCSTSCSSRPLACSSATSSPNPQVRRWRPARPALTRTNLPMRGPATAGAMGSGRRQRRLWARRPAPRPVRLQRPGIGQRLRLEAHERLGAPIGPGGPTTSRAAAGGPGVGRRAACLPHAP